ncbi:HIT family protein [Flavobacteriaceae bacterium]|nr:HIT family protein [Flavobacteriaceae bacterium]
MFKIDPKLATDSFFIKDLELSKLLLINDANYPWVILVPQKTNLVEIIDLSKQNQVLLMEEIDEVSKIIKKITNCDKINIANLGNVVSQLHIHIIARFKNDASFPQPIWGRQKPKPYQEKEKNDLIKKFYDNLS